MQGRRMPSAASALSVVLTVTPGYAMIMNVFVIMKTF
jgi:hypothetical protein